MENSGVIEYKLPHILLRNSYNKTVIGEKMTTGEKLALLREKRVSYKENYQKY